MRVHVTIPGSVESYCIDERGDRRKATDELWLETYLCSVLRAYSYADDGSGETIRKIMGVRRFNPVTNTETEHRFLNAAEQLFFRGMWLGRPRPSIAIPVTGVVLTCALSRMAIGLRLGRPSTEQRLESSHFWFAEILRDDRPLHFRDQLV